MAQDNNKQQITNNKQQTVNKMKTKYSQSFIPSFAEPARLVEMGTKEVVGDACQYEMSSKRQMNEYGRQVEAHVEEGDLNNLKNLKAELVDKKKEHEDVKKLQLGKGFRVSRRIEKYDEMIAKLDIRISAITTAKELEAASRKLAKEASRKKSDEIIYSVNKSQVGDIGTGIFSITKQVDFDRFVKKLEKKGYALKTSNKEVSDKYFTLVSEAHINWAKREQAQRIKKEVQSSSEVVSR